MSTYASTLPRREKGAGRVSSVPIARAEEASAAGVLERAFSICVLFLSTGAILGMIGQSPENLDAEGLGNANVLWQRILWIAVYGTTVALLIAHRKAAFRGLFANKFLSALFLMPLLSTVWSEYPKISLRHGLVMLGTSLFGVYFGTRFSIAEQLRLIARTMIWVAMVSIMVVVLLPDYGISHGVHFGDLRGVFTHKNIFGRYMALGVFVFLMLVRKDWKVRMKRGRFWLVTFIALVLLSGSKTAFAVLAIVFCALPALRILRRPALQLAGLAAGSVAVLVVAAPFLLQSVGTALKLLGRDATMSGRAFLWMGLGFRVFQRPWLGYGFDGFWQSDLVRPVWALIGWTPGHAHNGYLQLCLDLGIVGLAMFFAGFMVVAARTRKRFLENPTSSEALWPLAFFVFLLIYNLTECCLLRQNDMFWIIYVGIAMALAANGGREGDRTLTLS
jgi:exopolysaccharide production protein ExoQ